MLNLANTQLRMPQEIMISICSGGNNWQPTNNAVESKQCNAPDRDCDYLEAAGIHRMHDQELMAGSNHLVNGARAVRPRGCLECCAAGSGCL